MPFCLVPAPLMPHRQRDALQEIAPRPSTASIGKYSGRTFATRLRAYSTTGTVLICVSATAAMPVASDLPEIQARPVQRAASHSVTEMSAGLGQEVGVTTGEIVSTRGSLDVVGQDDVPVGSLVGRGFLSDYLSPHAEPATSTLDDQKCFGQGVLPDPLPMAMPLVANHLDHLHMFRNARGSLPDVGHGVVNVSSALPVAFGDLFSGGARAEFLKLQTALLNLAVTLNRKVLLLQRALLNLLVVLNRNVVRESSGGTAT